MTRPGVQIITPKDRQAWLRVRGRDITASTVGALFGEHEFLTVFELWARKTGRVTQAEDETPAMRRGRLLEPVAVQILREERPNWQITHNAAENVYYRDPAHRLGATPDVIVEAPGKGRGVVQIKSVEAGTFRRKWHPEGMDAAPEVPFWIALQATLEAYLVGAQWAAVAPLVIGHGLDMPLIEIPLDHMDGVIAAMAERAAEFWQMVEEGREPTPDFDRDGALIEAIYGFGDVHEEVDLTAEPGIAALIERAALAKANIQTWTREAERAEAQIKALMGTAEVAHVPGGRRITWKTYSRPNPGGVPSTYRVLRLPKT